ncbi:Uncharacterised protein [Starkeya nomas]|uniref:Protein AaeX n=1 Tax=Starkeya nomas TaxID=2666134 RepID=A0A5S9PC96_9HYPH|nr:DUF1656 domain-containing protein [Starkeya nomas]CAA0101482.1 Uncharacterised protein [Starkeya nomas]
MPVPNLTLFHPLEFVGFYVSPLVLWAAVAIIPYALAHLLLSRFNLYRFVWHRSLFNLGLYVLMVGALLAFGTGIWL